MNTQLEEGLEQQLVFDFTKQKRKPFQCGIKDFLNLTTSLAIGLSSFKMGLMMYGSLSKYLGPDYDADLLMASYTLGFVSAFISYGVIKKVM